LTLSTICGCWFDTTGGCDSDSDSDSGSGSGVARRCLLAGVGMIHPKAL